MSIPVTFGAKPNGTSNWTNSKIQKPTWFFSSRLSRLFGSRG